jgi:plastocyanin
MHRRSFRTALLAVVAMLVPLTACGGGGGGGVTKTATNGKIDVNAADIHFDVKTIKATAGPLTITLHETGALPHTFTIPSQKFELKVDNSHKSATGTVTLAKGTYSFSCSVDAHAAQGMNGKIVVS